MSLPATASRWTLYLDISIPQTSYLRIVPTAFCTTLAAVLILWSFVLDYQNVMLLYSRTELQSRGQNPPAAMVFFALEYIVHLVGAACLTGDGYLDVLFFHDEMRENIMEVQDARKKQLLDQLLAERIHGLRVAAATEGDFQRAWDDFIKNIDCTEGDLGTQRDI